MTNKTSINHKFFRTLRVLSVFFALGMFFSLSALAQEEQQRILPKPQPVPVQPQPIDGNVPCPDPKTITLTAPPPSAANVDPSQLPASLINPPNAEPNFGGTTPDKVFRHTFQFKLPENKCCQCTNVTLTLKLKALLDASDPNHSAADASNDKWYIYKNGELCGSSGFTGYGWVYDKPTKQGTVITKTIRIPCECLAVHGNAGKLTFVIQDDTSVQSATLTGNGCCVKGMQDPR
jgi:hypothetical protein